MAMKIRYQKIIRNLIRSYWLFYLMPYKLNRHVYNTLAFPIFRVVIYRT